MQNAPIDRRVPTKFDRSFHHDRPDNAENTILAHIAEGTMTPEDGRPIRAFVGEWKVPRNLWLALTNTVRQEYVCRRSVSTESRSDRSCRRNLDRGLENRTTTDQGAGDAA